MKKLLLLAALAAFVVPPRAQAGDVAMRVRDVRLGARALESASGAAGNFNMLGLHWIGSGSVDYRTRTLLGAWRPWRTADADDRTGSWHDGNLDWTGSSSAVQFRVAGAVRRLRSYELWSRVTTAPVRATAAANEPVIVSRQAWGADEEIVRAAPTIAPILRLAIVHHTAGTNSYTRAQAAAIVRGIEVYHVQGNGWNDIGYNFLIDRFGTVYEGRGGGIDQNVIGAHAQGFNSGTVGVALLGNFTAAVPTKAQQDALVQLLAWRLDIAHIDPLSKVVVTSGGNAKFRVRQARDSARGVGPSRHRPERMSRQPCLRAPAGADAARCRDGLAEAVRADGCRGDRYADSLPGSSVVGALVDGHRRRHDRSDRRFRPRQRLASSTGPGSRQGWRGAPTRGRSQHPESALQRARSASRRRRRPRRSR